MSLSFTTFQNPTWKDKIDLELRSKLESLTSIPYINQPQGLYAHHEAQLVGGIVFQKFNDVIWIDALWVDDNFKMQGIGRGLIDQLVRVSKSENMQFIQLNTFFSEAKGFLQACGFEIVSTIPNWKYGLNCYFMQKTIGWCHVIPLFYQTW
jgi:N-acetylglutamate synthase-like GNAT family acetyltransferase